jgi:hypothetical protein
VATSFTDGFIALIPVASEEPSTPGIITSVSTRAIASFLSAKRTTPVLPSAAVMTSYP